MTADVSDLNYLTIRISEKGISEVHSKRIVLFIPKSEIQNIELRSGSARKIHCYSLDLALCCPAGGIYGLRSLLSGNLLFRFALALVVFGCVGAWMIWETLQRQTYLLVVTASDSRKVIFKGKIEREDLTKFLEQARRQFGYVVSSKF